jgi:hypothetical protein
MLDLNRSVARLNRNAQAITALVEGVDAEQARWKPGPDKWSILEVVNHLIDEERADFRTRLNLVLHHPERPWPAIDPAAWARDRDYNQRDLGESLANFQRERRASIEWLEGLTDPQWDNQYVHPTQGAIPAGSLMVSWMAHDLLHIRQLTRLQWRYLSQSAKPYSTSYAGDLT